MKTLIITVGASGSGKSTWAKTYSLDNKALIISTDEERKRLSGNVNDQSLNSKVFDNCYKALREAKEDTVIFDSTALKWKYVDRIISEANKNEEPPAKVKVVMFEASLSYAECFERIKVDIANHVDRADVPNYVLLNQIQNYKKMLDDMKSFVERTDCSKLCIRSEA